MQEMTLAKAAAEEARFELARKLTEVRTVFQAAPPRQHASSTVNMRHAIVPEDCCNTSHAMLRASG